ncbi:hypothetical protein F4802DRAFT_79698 [Xylaria palmicola]|nr:hypothetical protein F4802DRAFT_79698 [Xylaria palmicola]
MPIFQYDLDKDMARRESAEGQGGCEGDGQGHGRLPSPTLSRRQSEESIRTELCEGPVPDSPPPPPLPPHPTSAPGRGGSPSPTACTDRTDLIERLKRGESPTWVPHRYYESPWGQRHPPGSPPRSPTRPANTSPALLPPPTITPEKDRILSDDERWCRNGMTIERPRSALHSGDFTHDPMPLDSSPSRPLAHIRTRHEPVDIGHPWTPTAPPGVAAALSFEKTHPLPVRSDEVRSALSSLSSSASTSFVYKPPTSPLFQSESNDEVDIVSPIDISNGFPGRQRLHSVQGPAPGSYACAPSPVQRLSPSLRQERTFPYQAHQPRRSLTTASSLSMSESFPKTPAFLHSRRPSIGSDASPLQHASMVGSYEESILRGRMSTTPSRPLDFLAQIGVLGLGKCKSNLRCPPHVTLPFPAVFYSYAGSSHGRSKEDDGPSPYVGQIDLENGLPNQNDDARHRKKQQSRAVERRSVEPDVTDATYTNATISIEGARPAQKTRRASGSPRAPPGGSYRIPEKGQIQIIIKNPNKTAVKLFLVPYDLVGMEPGTKTFVRQRSYSNGPIIDNMPNIKGDSSADRPILRYLVHLHICSPSRGRFYLYKSIRVVFANRVPDGKEKLHNEITLPEPRFTPYKAIRVMHPPSSSGTGPGASLAADVAFRRRSSGLYFGGAGRAFDVGEGFASPGPPGHSWEHVPAVEPVPFRVSAHTQTREAVEDGNSALSQTSRPTNQDPGGVSSWAGYSGSTDTYNKYNKLNKGDTGYGGNAFSGLINGNPAIAESLLSQRLRSLGVEKPADGVGEALS